MKGKQNRSTQKTLSEMPVTQILASSPIQIFLMISLPAFAVLGDGDDTFSSTSEMAALASREARLVDSLREYRERLEERLSKAKKSVEEIKRKLNVMRKWRGISISYDILGENDADYMTDGQYLLRNRPEKCNDQKKHHYT